MNEIAFDHITYGMILVFSLSLCFVFIAGEVKSTSDTDINNGYRINNYLKLTVKNVLFHLIGGFIVLMLVHEIGGHILEYITSKFFGVDYEIADDKKFLYVLSIISAFFGGSLLAMLLEKFAEIRNKRDTNIKHIHDENCVMEK